MLRVSEEFLHAYIKEGYLMVYGLVLMLAILYLPRGLMGLVRKNRGGDL